MPKTQPPGTVQVSGTTFTADALPDVFDARDLEYRPSLTPLQPVVDGRPGHRHVMTQQGNSCTGHAMAAMINAVLKDQAAEGREPIRVSPYMLYALARRYDDFEGERDEGSSLRGALKGWYYHGVLPEAAWPRLEDQVDLDLDRARAEEAMRHPLGAFYRVNAFRLDDLQSAVSELGAVVATAVIHEGWESPTRLRHGDRTLRLIERPVDARLVGGHAFAIVGYNEVGFLVQNSWGEAWGKRGFATLPYDDWLASAYDAWVARPGVHSVVTARERVALVTDTAGGLSTGPGPDLLRLQRHVVNLGNDGRLSRDGRFRSTPEQLDAIVERMAQWHEHWHEHGHDEDEAGGAPDRVVLYAHGGLNSEGTGLSIAQKHLNWWLNNRVYPVTFAWQTGPVETLVDHLTDVVKDKLPFGGLGFDLVEQFDRFVERFARSHVRFLWEEMKENAEKASGHGQDGAPLPADAGAGALLLADRLARHCAGATRPVEVHLVGHSAGSIFLAALLPALLGRKVPVASLSLLAPALRIDRFAADVLPLLEEHALRFCSFGLDDARELDDVCGVGGRAIYQKSLLYLVSRGLERPEGSEAEVPLLGMQRFFVDGAPGAALRPRVADLAGRPGTDALVWAPTADPPLARSDARSHGGLDDDAATMTSVLLRILGHGKEPTRRMGYAPHAALLDTGPEADPRPAATPPSAATGVREVADAGTVPVSEAAGPQPAEVVVPAAGEGTQVPEQRVAPRAASPVREVLLHQGWSVEESS